MRNTPTGVGKTPACPVVSRRAQKHPHGRGEDSISRRRDGPRMETPSRAWGRRIQGERGLAPARNTPTGVGKTRRVKILRAAYKKHPHGRGEDNPRRRGTGQNAETPPRAWGRPGISVGDIFITGNTPTGVGKTLPMLMPPEVFKKHPHGRGEDPDCITVTTLTGETPPRAWGRRTENWRTALVLGNTPTGVGKTNSMMKSAMIH